MKTISKGPWLGINNRLPDFALHKDKVGDYLRDAINVDVTDSGHLVRRKALILVQALTGAHSLFGEYLVIDSAIYRITLPAYTQTLVKTLASNAKMAWHELNGDIYYSNGTDTGRIDAAGNWTPWGLPLPAEPTVSTLPGGLPAGYYQVAVSYARYSGGTSVANLLEEGGVSPSNNYELTSDGALRVTLPAATVGATHINVYVSTQNGSIPMLQAVVAAGTATVDVTVLNMGRDAVQRFEEPLPAGHRVFSFNGRLCCLSGNTLYYGLPYKPGYYDSVAGRVPFPEAVSIAIGNQSGIYVAADKTYFIAGADLDGEVVLRDVLPYGAVPGTEFVLPNKENMVVGWFGVKGVVLADFQGQVSPLMADTVDQTPPASGFSAVFESGGYRKVVSCGWCVNLANGATTRYTDYDLTSTSGGYGTKADGLYALEGEGNVAWSVDLGKENFGAEQLKHMPAVYLGCSSDDPLNLRVQTPQHDYTYAARSYSDTLQEHRVDTGKGLRSNWFNLSLQGESDFTLASVSFAPVASTRRI